MCMMRTGQTLTREATVPADDPAWSTGQPLTSLTSLTSLTCEATIPADDPTWSTGQPLVVTNLTSLTCEVTIPAEDPTWSKPSHIPGQPQPIPPRNEPMLYIPKSHLASAVSQSAQDTMQHAIHYKTCNTEQGKHLHKFNILMLFAYDLLFRIKYDT